MLDVIAGHIPFMVVDLQPALQQIRDGKLRVLGVTTAKRIAASPDIPTLAAGGLKGFELAAWQGVVAPAGTPRAIVDQLARQIATLFADPATKGQAHCDGAGAAGRRRTVLPPISEARSIAGPTSSRHRAPRRNKRWHVIGGDARDHAQTSTDVRWYSEQEPSRFATQRRLVRAKRKDWKRSEIV
jgi:hypothetical protein